MNELTENFCGRVIFRSSERRFHLERRFLVQKWPERICVRGSRLICPTHALFIRGHLYKNRSEAQSTPAVSRKNQ